MAKYILVPLNLGDNIEKIIPRIENIAQAGMAVIFLVPYQTKRFKEKRQMIAQLSAKGISADEKGLLKHTYDQQTRFIDEKIAVARERLAGRELKLIGYVYMGRLSRILRNYKRAGNVHHVLKREGDAISLSGLISRVFASLSLVKRFASVLSLSCREKLDAHAGGVRGAAHNAG